MQIKGSHAVVTGGCRRIGLAISQALLREGAKVTVTFRTSAKECEKAFSGGPNVQRVELDLSDQTSIERAGRQIPETFGPIQILINCASDFFPKKLGEISPADWDQLHATNVKGHFFLIQSLLPSLPKGVILNIVDIHAHVPLKNFTAYVPQKAAFKMLTRNLALELAPKVRVNSISPGSVLFPENFTEDQKANHLKNCLLQRPGEAQDIVEAVKFLIGNDYITGFDLKVDGGSSLVCP